MFLYKNADHCNNIRSVAVGSVELNLVTSTIHTLR